MGCDIHAFLERKNNAGKYVMLKALQRKWYGDTCRHGSELVDRSYVFFAALAGVRGEGPVPYGIPKDVSESTAHFINEWGSDMHSHSHMGAIEFVRVYCKAGEQHGAPTFTMDLCCKLLGEDEIRDDDRIIFGFDN